MRRVFLTALLGLALASTSALACQKGGKGLWNAFYSVNPTAEQEERMESVMAAHKETMREQCGEKKGCSEALSGFAKSSFDQKAFVAAHQERMEAKLSMRAELFGEIHGILTAEQRGQFVEALAEKKRSCGEGRGHKKGGCDCGEQRSSCGSKADRGDCDQGRGSCGERGSKHDR